MKAYGLVESGDTKAFGIGAMTDLRWRQFFATMSAEGLYPKNLPYQKAYDLSFMRNAPQYFE
jgi:NitT/TauT family transport system substrate-binding protein